MADPKLHKFLSGGWNAMSRTDTQIYYDGAWHDPCSGSKTLWHFQDGAWHKFPCAVSDRILFSAYPQDFSSMAFVGLLNSDGSAFSENGQTVLPLTTSEHGYGGERDIRGFSYSRDYATVYGDRYPGLVSFGSNVHHDVFLEPNGGPDGPWVSFGWPETAVLPLDITFEVAGDGGFKWLLYDNVGRIPNQMLFSVAFAFFSWLDIGLFSDDMISDPALPDGWSLNYHAGAGHGELCRFYGGVEEDRWHTIGVRLPATGNMKLLVDGTEIDAGVTPFNNQVNSISAGIMGPNRAGVPVNGINAWGEGWYYIGEIRVGSRPFGCEHLRYAYWNAGYPWQYPFDTSEPFSRLPNMEFSPDGTERHAYVEIQPGDNFDSDLTDYLSWSYPSFSGFPGVYTNALSTPGSELWKLDQSGKRDVTLMNDNRAAWPAGSDRVIKVESYPSDFSRVEWENFNWQVSNNYGIDNALVSFIEVFDGNGDPVSLYRISLDPGTLGNTILIDSAFDYPSASGSPRYQSPACGFTPSGNRIWILRDFSSSRAILMYCLRDGTDKQTVTIPSIDSVTTMDIGYVVFDPADETIFYYTGTNSLGTAYHGIWKGNFNGDPFELVYEIPGYGLSPAEKPFPSTSIVEHFTYSDGPFGDRNTGRWQNIVNDPPGPGAVYEAQIVSNKLATFNATRGIGDDIFLAIDTGTPASSNSEAYATFYEVNVGQVRYVTLAVRAQILNPAASGGTLYQGYSVDFFPGSRVRVIRWNSGSATTIFDTGFGPGWIDGDKLGIRIIDQSGYQQIEIYKNDVLRLNAFDFSGSQVTSAGYIGIGLWDGRSTIVGAEPDSGLRADEFGGGEYVPIPPGDPHVVSNSPKISPDMTRLAFVLGDDLTGNPSVCSMLKDGTDFHDHMNETYPPGVDSIGHSFGWSPDGTEIGFWTFLFSGPDGSQGFGAVKIADDTQREIIAPGAMFQSFEANDFQWFHGWQGE